MAKAEGRLFAFTGPEKIRTDLLETFPFTGEEQRIEIFTKEFSAVCPFSGLPDLAKLIIRYIPNGKCVELKSLKYYIISYRNVGIYQEAATDRIYQDLKKALAPQKLLVRLWRFR